MASVRELDTETTEPARTSRVDATTSAIADGAASVANMTGEAAARLPGLVDQGRTTFAEANSQVRAASDQTLSIGTAVSFGFAVGLLIGGASRVIVAAAFVPVAMLGLTLIDRYGRTRPETRGAR